MSKELKLDFVWDKEVAKNSFDELYKYEFNHSAKKYIGWFFIAILQYGIVGALLKAKVAVLIFATVMLFYWYYGKKIIAKRRFLKNLEGEKDISLLVDSEGIKFFHDNLFWKWNEIENLVDVGSGILIIKYPNHYFIPEGAFKTFEEKNDFKKLFKESKNQS